MNLLANSTDNIEDFTTCATLTSLYGAVCAQSLGSWLPDPPSTLSNDSEENADNQLLFPDDCFFNRDHYQGGLLGSTDPELKKLIILIRYWFQRLETTVNLDIDEFANLGFNPITRFLILSKKNKGQPLAMINWLVRKCQPIVTRFSKSDYHRHLTNFAAIYRQQGWVFFNDASHHQLQSASLRFPSIQKLWSQGSGISLMYHHMSCHVTLGDALSVVTNGREPHMLADEWVIHEPVSEPNMD
ncbi:Uncharacterized protein HZ326_19561 [Fusarium oxysporum f. sp. albedinis]|nr:Uncharacterized protein HZ326_19561 [Fusarium oxysporum f. sp. albedinis]